MDNAYRKKVLQDLSQKFKLANDKGEGSVLPVGDNQGEGYQMPSSMELDPELQRDSELQERNAGRMEALRRMEQADEGMAQMQQVAQKKAKFEELRKRMRPKVETFPAIKPEDY
jgi:hypothetical protein